MDMHERRRMRWVGATPRALGAGLILATLHGLPSCKHRGDDDDDRTAPAGGGTLLASTGGFAPSGGASNPTTGGAGYGIGGSSGLGGYVPFPVGGGPVGGFVPIGGDGGEGGDPEDGGAGAAGEPTVGGEGGEPPVGGAAGEPPFGGAGGEPPLGGAGGEPPLGGAAGEPPVGGAAGEPLVGGAAGAAGGGAGVPGCPEVTPRSLAGCEAPGLTCTYPDCCGSLGTRVVTCAAPGKWVIDEELSRRCGTCPDALPTAGAACEPFTCDDLTGDNVECMYEDPLSSCSFPDLATCRGGTWVITPGCATSL